MLLTIPAWLLEKGETGLTAGFGFLANDLMCSFTEGFLKWLERSEPKRPRPGSSSSLLKLGSDGKLKSSFEFPLPFDRGWSVTFFCGKFLSGGGFVRGIFVTFGAVLVPWVSCPSFGLGDELLRLCALKKKDFFWKGIFFKFLWVSIYSVHWI